MRRFNDYGEKTSGLLTPMSDPMPGRDTPLIDVRVNEIFERAKSLEDAIARLEERLGSVLLPDHPQAVNGAEESCPVRPQSPLAERLEYVQSHLLRVEDQIRELTNRLEI